MSHIEILVQDKLRGGVRQRTSPCGDCCAALPGRNVICSLNRDFVRGAFLCHDFDKCPVLIPDLRTVIKPECSGFDLIGVDVIAAGRDLHFRAVAENDTRNFPIGYFKPFDLGLALRINDNTRRDWEVNREEISIRVKMRKIIKTVQSKTAEIGSGIRLKIIVGFHAVLIHRFRGNSLAEKNLIAGLANDFQNPALAVIFNRCRISVGSLRSENHPNPCVKNHFLIENNGPA